MIYIKVSLTSVSIKPPCMFLKIALSQSPHGSLKDQTRRPRNPYLNHSSTTTGDWGHRMRSVPWSSVIPHKGAGYSGWEGGQCPEPIRKHSYNWGLWCPCGMQTCFCYRCCLFVWCCLIFLRLNIENLEGKKRKWHFKNIYSQWCYLKVSIVYTLSYNPRHCLHFSKVYIQKYFLFILRFQRGNGIQETACSLS